MDENQKPKIKGLETLSSDMVDAFQGGEPGLIKKIIHSQEEQELEKQKASKQNIKNTLFALFGTLFFVAALGAVAFLYLNKEEEGVVVVPLSTTPVILADLDESINVRDFDRARVMYEIRSKIEGSKTSSGELHSLSLKEGDEGVSFGRFIALIEGSFPLEQAGLVDSNFFLGSYAYKNLNTEFVNRDAFLILKVRSFVDIFPTLRIWERKMFFDLSPIFGIATTPATEPLLIKDFEDGFVENKNARILSSDAGVPVLMYVFVDDKSVVIANSKVAVKEAIIRLSLGEVRK